jgi:putative redox protein
VSSPQPESSEVAKPIAAATVVDQERPYAVHIRTGHHTFVADEPVTHGGGDTAPNPTQLALGSLGACTAITLRMYAERHGWSIGRVEVRLELLLHNDQRRIEREIRIQGPLDAAQRARLLEIAARTPVTRLIQEGTPIETHLVEPPPLQPTAG